MMFFHRARAVQSAGLLTLLAFAAHAGAASVGDLAVIAYSADTPDAVTFVALRTIPAGTTIRFTDSGWQSSGSFRANEGGIEYTASGTLTPGTVVSHANPFDSGGWSVNNSGLGGGGFALSTSGDQILVFTGDASAPNFLHAVHFDGGGYSNATSSNTTAVPSGLNVGVSAVDIGEFDNGYYNGPTSGTPEALFAAIGDADNWVASESPLSPPNWNFTVGGGGVFVQSVALPGTSFSVGAATTVTVTLSAAPDAGSPVTVELTSGALTVAESLVIANPANSGQLNVTLANAGVWTLTASAVAGATGSADSAAFSVGSVQNPPTAYAGADRSVQLAAGTVAVALTDAAGDDADGLAGASYAWTPASAFGIAGWQNRTGALNATDDPAQAIVTFNAAGTYVLTLAVTDGDNLTAADNVTIFVTDPAPSDEYDPPAGYYASATGVGPALKAQLAQIMAAGHVQQSYGDLKTSAARYDADPNVPGHILLAYNRASVSGAWDGGSTWNREHVWPQSQQPGSASDGATGNLGDPFALRPSNPSINSSRGNKPFGTYNDTGIFGATGSIYYFPGDADKGDFARSLFYSATRYMSTLTLVNGDPGSNQMGDLQALVRWHYTDVPDTFERRRAQLIYADQHNRNAYIDHPEYVWSIFGDGANDSTLYVSAVEPPDGASAVPIDFSPIIVGGPLPAPSSVTLHKAGQDPTYFSVTAAGAATSSITGRFNAFDFAAQQRTLAVGLTGLTSTPGALSGTVVIDNLDISSEGQGQGAADGDDAVTLSLDVLAHANASFTAASDANTLTLDFGTVPAAAGVQSVPFDIHNLEAAAGYTAALDLLAVSPAGDSGVLTTDAAPFNMLPAGLHTTFNAEFDPASAGPGAYVATYVFTLADENLPGGTASAALTLTLTGTITAPIFPFDDDGDGDVDLLDVADFLTCLTGPGGGLATPACQNHDADNDNDVDLDDAATLQGLYSGGLP